MHAPRPKPLQEKFARSGFFLGALLFHLLIFLMVATWVIWPVPPPPPVNEFQAVAIKVPPPPPQSPSSGAEANNRQFEPQPVVVPVVTPLSTITSANSAFSVATSKALNQTLNHLSDQMAQGTGLSSGGGGNNGTGIGSGFGTFVGGINDFEGTVYDLKIGPDHRGTGMNPATYTRILTDFVKNGWKEKDFAPFFKASKKLYTPAIWIPTTPSPSTAKAMSLDNELTPTFWVGWYRAKVIAPQNGKYHFVGFGDDILAVAVNGQLVFDGSLWPVTRAPQHMPWPFDRWSVLCKWRGQNYGKLRVGDSFVVNTLEPVTIDVLMGDEPGGYYNAYLMIAEDSKTYPTGPDGVPLYPIFQLGSEAIKRTGDEPPHADVPQPWTGAP